MTEEQLIRAIYDLWSWIRVEESKKLRPETVEVAQAVRQIVRYGGDPSESVQAG